MKALRTGIEIDPYTFWVRYRLAQVLEEQKNNEGAAEQYEIALRYGLDRDPELYTRLARLYKLMGRSGDAVSLVRKGLRIFPTNSELYRLYAEVGGAN
jgi:tetratricopeptide (TPR) repeat protein